MATDFNGCGFGAITPDLILKSLRGCGGTTGQGVLRCEFYTNVATSPVHCGSDEDFEINLRRSIDMGIDGKPILRVNLNAEALEECGCGVAETDVDIMNSFFSEDGTGKVYFNMKNIT